MLESVPGVLFVIFLILKLTHTIDWSWWWVTSPLWIVFLFHVFVTLPLTLIVRSKAKQASKFTGDFFREYGSSFDRNNRR